MTKDTDGQDIWSKLWDVVYNSDFDELKRMINSGELDINKMYSHRIDGKLKKVGIGLMDDICVPAAKVCMDSILTLSVEYRKFDMIQYILSLPSLDIKINSIALVVAIENIIRSATDPTYSGGCLIYTDLKIFNLLLEQKGIDVNVIFHGETALIKAARYCLADVVSKLINCGADPNIENICGHSALWVAKANSHKRYSVGNTIEVIESKCTSLTKLKSATSFFITDDDEKVISNHYLVPN